MMLESGMLVAYEKWSLDWMDMREFSEVMEKLYIFVGVLFTQAETFIKTSLKSVYFIACKIYLRLFFLMKRKFLKSKTNQEIITKIQVRNNGGTNGIGESCWTEDIFLRVQINLLLVECEE